MNYPKDAVLRKHLQSVLTENKDLQERLVALGLRYNDRGLKPPCVDIQSALNWQSKSYEDVVNLLTPNIWKLIPPPYWPVGSDSTYIKYVTLTKCLYLQAVDTWEPVMYFESNPVIVLQKEHDDEL